jgi:predicted S18 family serine protease
VNGFPKSLTAVLVTAVLVSGGTVAVASSAVAAPETTVTVPALGTQTDSDGQVVGSAHDVGIRLATSGSKEFRVGFTEDEVAGTGDQWRAAGWNAATVATLLSCSPLTGREVTFDVTGEIDGPSAGALLTVGTLALIRGDKIKKDIAMTGTINPDGTVGPVGGIPFKIEGAGEAGFKRVLIPAGQRNFTLEDGSEVDVLDVGEENGVKVTEVADIYAAYKAFTGKTLPRPSASGNTELSPKVYDKIDALVSGWQAEYNSSVGEFSALDPTIQSNLTGLTTLAQQASDEADNLAQEGLQAGAYGKAVLAAAYANSAVKTGQALQIYLTQGVAPFISQIDASAAIDGKVDAALEKLEADAPTTLSEATGLIDAYGLVWDAASISSYADDQFAAANAVATPEEALTLLITGAVLKELAGTQIESADEIQQLSAGLPGPKLAKSLDIESVSDFFRKSAEANLNAFDTLFIASNAQSAGVDDATFKNAFAAADTDYLLALSGSNIGASINDKVKGKNAAYAKLGVASTLFARSAGLIGKYYSFNAITDADFNVTGVVHDRALISALDFAKDQAAAAIGTLRKNKVEPATVVGAYEGGNVEREGAVSNKLDALNAYWSAIIEGRVLSYLGGFEKTAC